MAGHGTARIAAFIPPASSVWPAKRIAAISGAVVALAKKPRRVTAVPSAHVATVAVVGAITRLGDTRPR